VPIPSSPPEEPEDNYSTHSLKPLVRQSSNEPEQPEGAPGISARRRIRQLKEISHWKREAKSEDTDRYFWDMSEVALLQEGTRYFVVGRKGTGKSAICERLASLRQYDKFATRLNFSPFPIEEL